MGVRGLTEYVRQCLSSFSTYVDLSTLHQSTQSPVKIIMDGNAFVHHISFCSLGKAPSFASDYCLLGSSIRDWISKCKAFGIELFFIFDGPTEPEKMTTRLSRLRKQSSLVQNSLLWLESVCLNEKEVPQYISISNEKLRISLVPPLLAISVALLVIQSEGVEYSIAPGEADKEIAAYARATCAYGVVSNDSDFICYDMGATGWIPLWAMELDDIESLCVYVVHRVRVAAVLKIPVENLPHLAALSGHDVSDATLLFSVHHKLFHPPQPPSVSISLSGSALDVDSEVESEQGHGTPEERLSSECSSAVASGHSHPSGKHGRRHTKQKERKRMKGRKRDPSPGQMKPPSLFAVDPAPHTQKTSVGFYSTGLKTVEAAAAAIRSAAAITNTSHVSLIEAPPAGTSRKAQSIGISRKGKSIVRIEPCVPATVPSIISVVTGLTEQDVQSLTPAAGERVPDVCKRPQGDSQCVSAVMSLTKALLQTLISSEMTYSNRPCPDSQLPEKSDMTRLSLLGPDMQSVYLHGLYIGRTVCCSGITERYRHRHDEKMYEESCKTGPYTRLRDLRSRIYSMLLTIREEIETCYNYSGDGKVSVQPSLSSGWSVRERYWELGIEHDHVVEVSEEVMPCPSRIPCCGSYHMCAALDACCDCTSKDFSDISPLILPATAVTILRVCHILKYSLCSQNMSSSVIPSECIPVITAAATMFCVLGMTSYRDNEEMKNRRSIKRNEGKLQINMHKAEMWSYVEVAVQHYNFLYEAVMFLEGNTGVASNPSKGIQACDMLDIWLFVHFLDRTYSLQQTILSVLITDLENLNLDDSIINRSLYDFVSFILLKLNIK